ncbi:hypothetical protein [Streptomyces venezuelae]|uniref:hypothetical protein n=1 Tax=Streptomyces venezuelae TaxID=54571 RepID=UPI0009A11DF0|nr:hypothetical protein [Streptomyces venezuelae]
MTSLAPLRPSRTASLRPRPCVTGQRAPGHTPVGLLVPPALEAFHILHSDVYSAYAHVHLAADAADKAVRSTFRVLASHWSYLLDQPDLTALAWEELVLHSQSRRCPLPGVATDDPLQYDALVLTDLGLGPRAIADITGQYVSTIRYLIAPHTLHTDNLLPARNR